MPDAVENYSSYIESQNSWALGRFVVPASRLAEFKVAAQRIEIQKTWRLSCLVGDDLKTDLAKIEKFNDRNGANGALVDTVETNFRSAEMFPGIAEMISTRVMAYFEVALDVPTAVLEMIRRAGARAKFRAGGLQPDEIPAAHSIANLLVKCAATGTGFKATAGLHHPFRSLKPLSYEPNAPIGKMHGFLNIFLAAAFARDGRPEEELVALIDENEATEFRFDDAGARWHNLAVTTEQISDVREQFAISFGSCSFEEPIDDLQRLQLL